MFVKILKDNEFVFEDGQYKLTPEKIEIESFFGGIDFFDIKNIFHCIHFNSGSILAIIDVPEKNVLSLDEKLLGKASQIIFKELKSLKELSTWEWFFEIGVNIQEGTEIFSYPIENNLNSIIDFLIKKGVDIHSCNEMALRSSVAGNNLKLIEKFLNMGADINVDNEILLAIATENFCLESLKYLINHGIKINTEFWEGMITRLVRNNRCNELKILLKACNYDASIIKTIIRESVLVGRRRPLQFLIKENINIFEEKYNNSSKQLDIITRAKLFNNLDILDFLLEEKSKLKI